MADEVFKMCLCAAAGHKLIDELPLHKVINHYTSLAHINGLWFGECPFSKRGKIIVNDDEKRWKSTGCEMEGDVFDFMKIKFAENFHSIANALTYLAKNK